jgi:hypothetical protein
MSTGWICPKCQRCFAPHVNECAHCAQSAVPKFPIPAPGLTPAAPLQFPWPTTICMIGATGCALDQIGFNGHLNS